MSRVRKNLGAIRRHEAGSVLSLLTWSQREDPHWFGGRIPAEAQSIECGIIGSKDNPAAASYQRYDGSELQRTKLKDAQAASARRDAIPSERASVMP
jgi:hypothetical protein